MTNEVKEKIRKTVADFLENRLDYTKDGAWYEYELYADYRDEMSNKTAIEILESDEPMQQLREKIDDWWLEIILEVEDEHIKEIKDELENDDILFPKGMDDEAVEYLKEEFRDTSYISPPYEHYLKQSFRTNIMLDTGDGNYDYTLNTIYPAYGGRYGETIDDKASIVWLAKKQGYTKTELKNALNLGDMRNPKGFLESLRVEVANEASHMNTLCFLAEMTLEELIKVNELVKLQDIGGHKYDAKERPYCGYLVIGKEAETGLYDPWNGSGSLFEIELEKDVRVPVKFIRSALPDGGDGYSIDEVYGMCGSCWREDVVKKIHAPKCRKE